jgi:hypothetical protein
MKIDANWVRNYIHEWGGFRVAPAITMADEEEISVQGSHFHYCIPRVDEAVWTHVECGFPTFRPSDAMMEFAEDAENPQYTVYPYTPIEIVVDEINAHGGVDESA